MMWGRGQHAPFVRLSQDLRNLWCSSIGVELHVQPLPAKVRLRSLEAWGDKMPLGGSANLSRMLTSPRIRTEKTSFVLDEAVRRRLHNLRVRSTQRRDVPVTP
jgi:hypothetical protein